VKGRGRPIVALLLVGFVLVATGVIWRRSFGIAQSRELRDLDRQRLELEARKARLQGEIRELSSRARLAPIAEQRLNMHVPNASQVIYLPRPSAPRE
jgi:cell division protein FtsL